MTLLSVITVTFNSEEVVSKFLSGLNGRLPQKSEVIIIDNNSTDKTVEMVEKYLSRKNLSFKLKLIKNTENTGFSKANNVGAKSSSGAVLLFLNPDVKLEFETADKMLEFITQKNDAGLVAPKLIGAEGKVQASVRKEPTLMGAFQEYFLGLKNKYNEYIPLNSSPSAVDCVYAAAVMVKRELFEKLGGFDERYFVYYEDLDLCKRVRKLGMKVYYLGNISAEHLLGASGAGGSSRTLLNEKSAKIYFGDIKYYLLKLLLTFRPVK